MSLFSSTRVSEHVTRIETAVNVAVYLVEGSKGAALLDTGFGIGDLRGYVETLTTKHLVVLLSHGHCDHAGGSTQFDDVRLNERDWALERVHDTLEHRVSDVMHGPFPAPEGVGEKNFQPQRTQGFSPLSEGDVTELGGVSVEAVEVPGHTTGSLVFLVPEDRIAVFGDTCGEHTLLLFPESSTIADYKASLERLEAQSERWDVVLRNHGSYRSEKQILPDCIALCGEILAGTDAAIPTRMNGFDGCAGRPERHPGTCGNIIYNPARLR